MPIETYDPTLDSLVPLLGDIQQQIDLLLGQLPLTCYVTR